MTARAGTAGLRFALAGTGRATSSRHRPPARALHRPPAYHAKGGGNAASRVKYCGLFLRELILAYAAQRANPILRNIFPFCACCYAVVRIALSFVINVTANVTYIFLHF